MVKTIEKQGAKNVPYVHRYPEVRGGVCEFCGIIDPNKPSTEQYKLCPHWQGQPLECGYCPPTKNPEEVNYKSVLNIYDHPDRPDKLVVVCDNFSCVQAHENRFKR